jgi:hypothetical protein
VAEFLIAARDMEFRDLSSLPAILRAHSLLSVMPATSLCYPEARAAIEDVLATLLAFTQPNLDPNKVSIRNSMIWLSVLGRVTDSGMV